jgi:hypothetical protein
MLAIKYGFHPSLQLLNHKFFFSLNIQQDTIVARAHTHTHILSVIDVHF